MAKKVRVRWHTYGQSQTRVEWLDIPEDFEGHPIHGLNEWISAHLREREGLPPDDHKYVPGRRPALWFEWDRLR